MVRCQICGKPTSSITEIIDKDFGVIQGRAKVCSGCFDLWRSEQRDILLERVRNKLRCEDGRPI